MSDQTGATPPEGRAPTAKTLWMVVLEAILISAGVFLGLLGDQWRDDARRRETAEGALRRFRVEMVANREAVVRVQDYHTELKTNLDAYFAADPDERGNLPVRVQGLQPPMFDHSAWDLAIGNQALADIDQELAFEISRIYRTQETYDGISASVGGAIDLLPWDNGAEPLLRAFWSYLGDAVLFDPALLRMYDEIMPAIDRELGESPS